MNKLETNALRIAELLEYDEWRLNNIQDVLICRYTAYDYLMPIVFECNSNAKTLCDIRIGSVVKLRRTINWLDGENFVYDYNTEPEFIEAIQECVIKYLELKCLQQNIADNIE